MCLQCSLDPWETKHRSETGAGRGQGQGMWGGWDLRKTLRTIDLARQWPHVATLMRKYDKFMNVCRQCQCAAASGPLM